MTFLSMPTVSVAAAFRDAARAWHDRPFLYVTEETAGNLWYPSRRIDLWRDGGGSHCRHCRIPRVRLWHGTSRRADAREPTRGIRALVCAERAGSKRRTAQPGPAAARTGLSDAAQRNLPRCLLRRGTCGSCTKRPADAQWSQKMRPSRPLHPRHATRRPGRRRNVPLLYTSGTTGRPKGCVLSNDYFLRCGRWYTEIGGLCALRPGEDRLITPLPMTHVNAMAYSTLAMVMTGGCIIPLDRFHPRSWWRTVRDSEATIMHSLGVIPTMLLGLDASPDNRAHQVRFGFAPASIRATTPRSNSASASR